MGDQSRLGALDLSNDSREVLRSSSGNLAIKIGLLFVFL